MRFEYGVSKYLEDFEPPENGGEYVHGTKVISHYSNGEGLPLVVQRVFTRLEGSGREDAGRWKLWNPLRGEPAEIYFDPETNLVVRKHFISEFGRHKIQEFDPENGNLIYQEHYSSLGPTDTGDGTPAKLWFDRETGEETRREFWRWGARYDPDSCGINHIPGP